MNFAERVAFRTNPLSRLRGEGCFRDEPLPSFRFAKCQFPFLSPGGVIFPRPGEVFRRESPWQRGQVSSSFVNGRRSQPISCKLSALAKASPFRERWHGEAVTERVSPRLAVAFGECFPNRSRGKIGKSVCARREHPLRRLLPSGASHGRNVNKKIRKLSALLHRSADSFLFF